MSNPNIPNFLGMNFMNDTLEFMKNMWGSMGASKMSMPGMVMPTLSVEEIDKQIKDLKAVEAWLNVNMTMLRGTIQALEVQSATISTLHSMGQSLSAAVSSNAPSTSGAASAGSASNSDLKRKIGAEKASSGESNPDAAGLKSTASDGASSFAAPLANPAVWWNMLQDQFKQAVNTSVANEEPAQPEVVKPTPPAKAPPRKRKSPPKA